MTHWLYYHQLDPFLLQITESFGIRWYSLAYICGILAAYFLAFYFIRRGRLSLPENQVLDIVTYGAIGAVLGGRLGYCLFYNPELLFNLDSSFPFWGALKIHEGGMASHGGIFGFILSQWIYSRKYQVSFYALMDLGALGGSVGLFLGRIANFINGELFGRVIEKRALLGVQFPNEIFLWLERAGDYQKELLSLKPILPLLKSLSNLQIQIPHPYIWESWVQRAAEDSSYKGYLSYFCNLIVDMSNHAPIKTMLESILSVRHPSQFYQSFFGGLLPLLIIYFLWLKPRKVGIISLVWILVYLTGRIFTEFYRMPDISIGYQFLHFTRGQWLSCIALITIGSVYSYLVYKKNPKGFDYN